jgi:hypothetical protein
LDLAHTALREQIGEFARTIDKNSQPMPIQKGRILDNPLATSSPFTPPLSPEEKEAVVRHGKSVGHLMSQISHTSGKTTYFPWGTTFVVAPGVIATNCHVLDSLVTKENGSWQLVPEAKDALVVDFGEKSSVSTDHVFRVTGFAANPNHTGFDVAFLTVSSESITGHNHLPDALPLEKNRLASPPLGSPELFVLVGYPDTKRSLDPNVTATYAPFRDQGFAKFAVLGGVTAVNKCQAPLDVILDTASTTEGQSGSVLIDRKRFNVIGIHDCCATYSTVQPGLHPPADFPCGTLRTTYYNQAISSWSILSDATLSGVLKQQGILSDTSLSGHPKTGHTGSLQNRP